MKKLLALVLALVMTLGLATVGANAATTKYADASDITYKEAVDVMSDIGVLAGDETGFRPTDTLKRSEGAKIIAYLIAGKATADAMTATGTKYTDLAANHWAAGYMEYLSAIGVMGGLGDGRIDPDGSLSATAFAKMLLVALGYDAKLEGFGGADWQINVQRVANRVGIFKGNSAVVGSAAVTREEAALYALNTLKAPLVEYETKGTQINVGDASITTGASNWSYMTTTDNSARYRNIDNARVNGNGAQIVEFAEEYYDGLKLADAGTDAFGRPANVWTLKGKEVGTYSKASDLQYTAAVKMGAIYADLGLTDTIEPANIEVYEDGVIANNTNVLAGTGHASWTTYRLMKNSDKELGGNGALTEVYYDDDDNSVQIFVQNTYFAKVVAAYAATNTRDAYVNLGSMANSENTGLSTTYNTEDFKVGDYVLYTASYKDVTNGIPAVKSMELATAVQGNLSAYQVGTNVTVDGTTIKSNVVAASKGTIDSSLQNAINTNVTVFKDKYDYAVAVDATAAQDNYAVVLGWTGNDTVGTSNRTATLLMLDGTKKTVTVDSLQNAAGNTIGYHASDVATGAAESLAVAANQLDIGDVVTYRIGTDGKYKLTLAADTGAGYTSATFLTKGSAALNGVTGIGGIRNANGKTVFALYNSNSGSVTVYTGIANVPDVDMSGRANNRATAYSKDGNGIASLVFVDVYGASVKNSTKDVIFIKGGTAGEKYDEIGGYYEYDAIINDEITKIKIDSRVSALTMVTNMTKNSKDVYNWASRDDVVSYNSTNPQTDDPVYYTTGTDAVTNGTAFYGSGSGNFAKQAVNMASNPKVFNISASGTITESTLGAIQLDANDQVFWKLTDGLATTIVFKTIDGAATTVGTDNSVVVKGTTAGQYFGATFYTADGHTITYAEANAALVAQMTADGCTDITFTAGNVVRFTLGNVTATQTIANMTAAGTLAVAGTAQVYKVSYINGTSAAVDYYLDTTADTDDTADTGISTLLGTDKIVVQNASGDVIFVGTTNAFDVFAGGNMPEYDITIYDAGTYAAALNRLFKDNTAVEIDYSSAAITLDGNVEIPAGTTVTMANGTELRGGNSYDLTVRGTLKAASGASYDLTSFDDIYVYGTLTCPGNMSGANITQYAGSTVNGNNVTVTTTWTVACTATVSGALSVQNLVLVGDDGTEFEATGTVTTLATLVIGYADAAAATATSGAAAAVTLPAATITTAYVNGTNTLDATGAVTVIDTYTAAGTVLTAAATKSSSSVELGTVHVTGALILKDDSVSAAGANAVQVKDLAIAGGGSVKYDATITDSDNNNAPSTSGSGASNVTSVEGNTSKEVKVEIAGATYTRGGTSDTWSNAYMLAGDTIVITFKAAVKGTPAQDVSAAFTPALSGDGLTLTLTVKDYTSISETGSYKDGMGGLNSTSFNADYSKSVVTITGLSLAEVPSNSTETAQKITVTLPASRPSSNGTIGWVSAGDA